MPNHQNGMKQNGMKQSGNTETSHYQWLCVVVGYLVDFNLISVGVLGEGGANLPVCTEYAEFIQLKLIALRND